MKDIFIQIVKLSLSAALIAGLVMLLRLALKKSPRFLVCALWALVAVRLLIPALPESRASVMPQRISSGTVVEEVAARPVEPVVRVTKDEPQYVKIIQKTPQIPVKYQGGQAYVEVSEKTLEAPKTVGTSIVPVLAWIWLGGAVLMLAYMGFSYFRIWRKVRISVRERDHIYICDTIASPFILGVFRPKIYVPSTLEERDKAYVLAHEQAHLKRLDHVWKPLGWVLLSLHWFNPVMWAAYILLCRDIELACDEKVTGREGDGYRKAYSEALLACSMPARLVTACPLAFGEVGVKTRIKSVLNYKRPAFWILALTLAACIIAAGCALTNPTEPAATADPSATSENTETPMDPATAPTDSAAPTDPTASADPVKEPSSEASSQAPEIPRGKVKTVSLTADQEGVMLAERTDRMAPGETDAMPADVYPGEFGGAFILDRSGKQILNVVGDKISTLSLDFCKDPLRFLSADEFVPLEGAESDPLSTAAVIYVLSSEALYRLPMAWSELYNDDPTTYETIALPEGVRAEDVRDMVLSGTGEQHGPLLITDTKGNYKLQADHQTWEPSQEGYAVNWKDGSTLEIYNEQVCWTVSLPRQDVRVLAEPTEQELMILTREENAREAYIYDYRDGYCYVSRIEMEDWENIPENFARLSRGSVYVLAPRESGICVQRLVPGVSSVYAEGVKEDLTARREEILAGAVLPLYDHKQIDENFPGFLIDMDGDGTLEEIGIAPGLGNRNALTWELNLNGRPAGVSWMNYAQSIDYGSPYANDEILWPEEGNFSRERGYEMYLASLDGEHITLFLESMQETYGLDFLEYQDDETLRAGVRTRIRGLHKMMGEFTPNAPLADYIAAGWKVRPADGDRLDLTGNGEENTLRVTNHSSLERYPVYHDETGMNNVPFNKESMQIGDCWPYSEFVAADNGEAFAVVYTDRSHTGYMGDTMILSFRYGDLYYERNTQGGYDLIGELTLNGSALATRYKLTDEEWNPVTPDAKLSKAGFRALSGSSHPLPGAREEDELALRYFAVEREADGGVPAPEGDLETMDKLFRDVFTGFFLMDEYEDVRDIDLGMLFYNGLCTGIAPDQSSELVVSEEEKAEALAAMGETHPLQPLFRIDRQAAEDAFRKFTGYELSEATGKMPGTYVEKYDAWYYLRSDSARSNFRIADAYLNKNGEAAVLWNGMGLDTYGIVNLKPAFGGYYIVANRVLTEEELTGAAAQGSLRAPGTKLLDYGSDVPRAAGDVEWDGSPILPVDFQYSAEMGTLILDQLGKRLIYQSTMAQRNAGQTSLEPTASVSLDFCNKPERMAAGYYSHLYILDGNEVLYVKTDTALTGAELQNRISLPEGVDTADVLDLTDWLVPGTAENILLLITRTHGNYQLSRDGKTFEPSEHGWQMERQGSRVTVRLYDAVWDLEIEAEDVQVAEVNNNSYQTNLTLYVREKDADRAEFRRYDRAGRLEAVSQADLRDLVLRDGLLIGHGESNAVMVHRYDGLYRYFIDPGVNHLEREPLYFDFHTKDPKEESILQGEIVDLSFMKPILSIHGDKGIGCAIDMDQDGIVDTISLEPSVTPSGEHGLEFYYNGQRAGVSRTLYGNGQITEHEEPAFFTMLEGYQLFLASLDGRTISLIMTNDQRTLAVEFVPLESNFGGVKGGYFARVRMRGEGMTQFFPCLGIQKYLEDGWEVRPSEGDVLEGLSGAADGPQTVHMTYLIYSHNDGNFYKEMIRLGDSTAVTTLGFTEGEYDLTYHRFDHLTYAPAEDSGLYLWLKGWMNDGSRETVYGVTGNDGVLQYQIVETAQTTEQPADRIVINLFPEGDTYSMPIAAEVAQDDPLFEAMSWEELAAYYGLTINPEAIASLIESFTGEPFTYETAIFLMPSSGIYRNGEYVYDVNTLEFRSTAKNSHRSVTIGFFRDTNVLQPKLEYYYDFEAKRLEMETQYEASYISGVKCYIGQTVYSDGSVVKSSYEIDLHQPVLTIETNDLTEEQVTALLGELFKELGIKR